MCQGERLCVSEDWEFLLSFLPQGWQDKAKELGALRRRRKIPDAEHLLRLLLIHLAEGCSLRQTAARARDGHIVQLSDVAILDRLRQAGEWFRWINVHLMEGYVGQQDHKVLAGRWNVRLVDGTCINEPGPSGSSWRLHYSISLPSLSCQEAILSKPKGPGESFQRYRVAPGDLMIADRVYATKPSIFHVSQAGGDVLVRFPISNLPMQDPAGEAFNVLEHVRVLKPRELGDWPVRLDYEGRTLPGRVCAVKKSRQAAERERRRLIQKGRRSGTKPRPETLEAAGYTFIFTTVALQLLLPSHVLAAYRGRWQIEVVFKRLKSIMELGHLRKVSDESTKAWIQGKLLVALLIEALLRYADSFSPWGYPVCPEEGQESVPVA